MPRGAAVSQVSTNSPAEKAGIKANDIITAVNGIKISGSDELKDFISDSSSGDILTLTVYRQGQTIEIKVTVEVQRQSALGADSQPQEDNNCL